MKSKRKTEPRCPLHGVVMNTCYHKNHIDYQCPQCFNIVCPELSPKITLEACGVKPLYNWHGDKKLIKEILDEYKKQLKLYLEMFPESKEGIVIGRTGKVILRVKR